MSGKKYEGWKTKYDEGEWSSHYTSPLSNRNAVGGSSRNTQGPSKKDGCFVAGVIYAGMAGSAYGGGDVEQVNVLREYRDDVLMQDALGKKFVDWYYGGGGERLADLIGNRARFLIPVIRKGLDFIVEDYKIRKRT